MAETSTPLLIVNPNSGGGKTGREWPDLQRRIEARIGAVEVAFTKRSGHGIELAEEAANAGRKTIVAVGGDGSMNEIVNGVLRSKKEGVEIGLIAQGTGGDFRKTLDLAHDLDAYLDALASGRTRKIDAGRVRYHEVNGEEKERFFLNIVSAGMGGLVDRYVATASRALGGSFAYFGASFRALLQAKRGALRITVTREGKTTTHRTETYVVAVCNGKYFGSGMKAAPMAEPDDAVLELITFGPQNKLAFAATSSAVYEGNHLRHPDALHVRGEHFRIELENEADARARFLIDLDGEPLGGLPMEVDVLPSALTFRV